MRIHITGNAGAGKTTLATYLGNSLGLPVFHLDQIVWQPHWVKTPAGLRAQREQDWCKITSWVIDGVSKQIRDEADLVIILESPRYLCIWRCLKRNVFYLFRSRPELPENCPEILVFKRLLKIIWSFPKVVGSHLVSEAKETTKYRFIRSKSDLEAACREIGIENIN